MINKRLLVKNLLAYNDENSFYDKKIQLNLENKEGKSKFLKHVCALSNSNPFNNAYMVIGVEDETNKIVGVDFYDDSKIQNLINAYLSNPPKVQYENIAFPRLPRHKVVGLVTIQPNNKTTSLVKGIWKYPKQTVFVRQGSTSIRSTKDFLIPNNKAIVEDLERHARNNIQLTLDGVFDFKNEHQPELNPQYLVFKDHFVLCWAGLKKKVGNKTLYSRVDIALVNEQTRLFYSTLDEVEIEYNSQSFIITEYVELGLEKQAKYVPLEKTVIHFKDNGAYDIVSELLFHPPSYDKVVLKHIFNHNNVLIDKLEKNVPLKPNEKHDLIQLPTSYLICHLNGFKEAKTRLEAAKKQLRNLTDKTAYIKFKETKRILRKIKYN
ncbi:ATP-binding protein [Flavobacteriaceae bacterium F08102]|nr:ATP-binding protein [Flavobacteriaceae bacterium F08102]